MTKLLSERILKAYLYIPVLQDQSLEGLEHLGEWANEVEQMERELRETKEELQITDDLFEGRDAVLRAIPEDEHGPCIPHALEWIERAKGMEQELERLRPLAEYGRMVYQNVRLIFNDNPVDVFARLEKLGGER